MASPKIKNQVNKANLTVFIEEGAKTLTIFRWLTVSELKAEIYKVTGIPPSEQRLFNGLIELCNPRLLEDYSLFSTSRKIKHLVLEFKIIFKFF